MKNIELTKITQFNATIVESSQHLLVMPSHCPIKVCHTASSIVQRPCSGEIERGQLGPLFETAVGKRSTHSGEKLTVERSLLWNSTVRGARLGSRPFGEHSYFGHTSRTRGGLGVRRMKIEES